MLHNVKEGVAFHCQRKVPSADRQRVLVTSKLRLTRSDKIGKNNHAITQVIALANGSFYTNMCIDSNHGNCGYRALMQETAYLVIREGAVPVFRENQIIGRPFRMSRSRCDSDIFSGL